MPIIETLFAKQADWIVKEPIEPLKEIAKQFGFTEDSFNQCLANQKVLDDIQAVRDHAAEKLGVNSTPTFFINGKKLVGDLRSTHWPRKSTPISRKDKGFFAPAPGPAEALGGRLGRSVPARKVWKTRRRCCASESRRFILRADAAPPAPTRARWSIDLRRELSAEP